jgi:hypothetical protein
MERVDTIYILADREDPVRIMDADYLVGYLENGFASYLTAEEAEEGRKRGDAYDDPGATRVVGFCVKPFLPKKERKKTK